MILWWAQQRQYDGDNFYAFDFFLTHSLSCGNAKRWNRSQPNGTNQRNMTVEKQTKKKKEWYSIRNALRCFQRRNLWHWSMLLLQAEYKLTSLAPSLLKQWCTSSVVKVPTRARNVSITISIFEQLKTNFFQLNINCKCRQTHVPGHAWIPKCTFQRWKMRRKKEHSNENLRAQLIYTNSEFLWFFFFLKEKVRFMRKNKTNTHQKNVEIKQMYECGKEETKKICECFSMPNLDSEFVVCHFNGCFFFVKRINQNANWNSFAIRMPSANQLGVLSFSMSRYVIHLCTEIRW